MGIELEEGFSLTAEYVQNVQYEVTGDRPEPDRSYTLQAAFEF